MTLIFNPEVQNAALNTVRDAIDSGGSAGSLEILSGATVIASLPLSLPSFADESGGQSVANAITSSAAIESGTPDGFRFVTSYGATAFAGDIPDDLDLGVAVISSGQTVGVSSYVLTQGNVQSPEFVSTIEFPYNTPPLAFDPTPAPSSLVGPKDLKLENLRGQDFESDGTTLRTATYDGNDVLLDGVPLFAAPDVKALDLTFDASDNALVVFTDSGDNLFVYADSDQTTTDLTATGQDPRIHNDRQASPSIVLSYRRGNDVFYRLNLTGLPAPTIWGPLATTHNTQALIHAGGSDWVFAGLTGQASETSDAGVSFNSLPPGLNSGNANAGIMGLATDKNGVIVAVMSGGYAARSLDFGKSWAALPTGLGTPFNQQFNAVATDEAGVFVAGCNLNLAARSIDNGATWGNLVLDMGAPSTSIFAIASAGPVFVAFGSSGRVSRSADAGANWTPHGSTLAFTPESAASDGADVFVVVGQGGLAARSVDGGLTFNPVTIPTSGDPGVNLRAVGTDRDGNWVATAVDGGASLSTDNGVTWGALNPQGLNSGDGTPQFLALDVNRSNGVWMVSGGDGFCSISPPL